MVRVHSLWSPGISPVSLASSFFPPVQEPVTLELRPHAAMYLVPPSLVLSSVSTFQDHYDYIGTTWVIQDNCLISKSAD